MDVEVRLAGPTIKAIRIGGDFFAPENAVSALEASLRWRPSHRATVREALDAVYSKRPDELTELPIDALTHAIDEAVRHAREPYGCFVSPRTSHA